MSDITAGPEIYPQEIVFKMEGGGYLLFSSAETIGDRIYDDCSDELLVVTEEEFSSTNGLERYGLESHGRFLHPELS